MSWIIGFDLSLVAPAAVALPLNWKPGDWKRVHTSLIKPEAPKNEDLAGRVKRFLTIAKWAGDFINEHRVDTSPFLFVEAYGFSKNNAQASQIQESGGVVKAEVYRRFQLVVYPVASNTARKLFLGKCPQKNVKLVVQDKLFNVAGAPKGWDENQADAFVVANWGLSEAGGKCLSLAEMGESVRGPAHPR